MVAKRTSTVAVIARPAIRAKAARPQPTARRKYAALRVLALHLRVPTGSGTVTKHPSTAVALAPAAPQGCPAQCPPYDGYFTIVVQPTVMSTFVVVLLFTSSQALPMSST